MDYTCRDSLAASYVASNAKEAGNAAVKAEKGKTDKYSQIASSGYIVMPVANETLGSWGPQGMKFIKEIGRKITEITGEKRATYHLFQSIGIATQRGNAASIFGTLPSGKKLDELYYLP